jgi:hypothetical protein
VFNQGAIDAPAALVGIAIHAGGYISNATSGVITGTQFGAYFTHGSGTILNAGTIGETGTAGFNGVGFDAGYTNRLVVDPGAVFLGQVDGGNTIGATAISTLELASGSTAGMLAGLGSQFVNFDQTTVDSGANWTLTGAATTANNATLTSSGTLTVANYLANEGFIKGIVTLASGAGLTNFADSTISHGSGPAIYGAGAGIAITNAGLIESDSTKAAVALHDGGVVINGVGATIEGTQHVALYFTGATAGTVVNNGAIYSLDTGTSGASAVVLKSGGYLTNSSTGSISAVGGAAVYVIGGLGTLFNSGIITNTGSTGTGVALDSGGYLSNASGGVISSTHHSGVYVTGTIGTVTNAGLIEGASAAAPGVFLVLGGVVSNAGMGTIEGSIGVRFSNVGTLIDDGSIIGASGTAVSFVAGANRLVVGPDALFSGTVNGANPVGSSIVSTLELAPTATVSGTLTGIGTTFTNFGSIVFDAGGTWFIAGDTMGLGGTISGFALGDTIEVTGVTATGSSYSGGVLTRRKRLVRRH